jgi:hypothetical protein
MHPGCNHRALLIRAVLYRPTVRKTNNKLLEQSEEGIYCSIDPTPLYLKYQISVSELIGSVLSSSEKPSPITSDLELIGVNKGSIGAHRRGTSDQLRFGSDRK